LQKRDRAEMDGEERERKVLEDQIARARAAQGDEVDKDVGLQKQEGEKVTLNLNLFNSAKPDEGVKTEPDTITGSEAGPSRSTEPETKPAISFGAISTPSATPSAPVAAPMNPLKRPAPVNVFKQSKSAKTESDAGTAKKGYTSEAERLMKEDQARRLNRGPSGYGGFGPNRETGGVAPRRFVLQ